MICTHALFDAAKNNQELPKNLTHAAGSNLKAIFRKSHANGISPGQVAIFNDHKLDCNTIYFGFFQKFNETNNGLKVSVNVFISISISKICFDFFF